nr:MAG TPA: hypothetical protein [Caudoviricetes sp.]
MRFLLAVTKILSIFATVKQSVVIRNRRARRTSSPELIKNSMGLFLCPCIAASLQ